MTINTFFTIGTFPKPTVFRFFNSVQEKLANLQSKRNHIESESVLLHRCLYFFRKFYLQCQWWAFVFPFHAFSQRLPWASHRSNCPWCHFRQHHAYQRRCFASPPFVRRLNHAKIYTYRLYRIGRLWRRRKRRILDRCLFQFFASEPVWSHIIGYIINIPFFHYNEMMIFVWFFFFTWIERQALFVLVIFSLFHPFCW